MLGQCEMLQQVGHLVSNLMISDGPLGPTLWKERTNTHMCLLISTGVLWRAHTKRKRNGKALHTGDVAQCLRTLTALEDWDSFPSARKVGHNLL